MATDEHWERVKGAARQGVPYGSCLLQLRDRVEALEANMNGIAWAFEQHAAKWNQNAESENLRQQDEDVERVATDPQPIATNEEILRVYWAGGNSSDHRLRHVYDLGRQHGATQSTCPHIRKSDEGTGYCALAEQSANSVDAGLLPMIVSETGSDDEAETERIICSAISNGADYVNGMPRELSLERTRYGLHIGSLRISARYVQAPLEVAGPTPSPTDGLVERVATSMHPDSFSPEESWGTEARAVIREVADWLEQQQEVPIGRSTASADYFAAMLRSEANR